MSKDTYMRLMRWVKSYPSLVKFICIGNKVLTGVVYVSYIVFLLALLMERDIRVVEIVAVTGCSFIVVSVFRKIMDRPRPYEYFHEPPVIEKRKSGSSFPSRHVFSAFVIAMAGIYVNAAFGIFLLVVGSGIAVLRVLGGVHYVSDVLAGALIGIFCGTLGFLI